MLGIKDAYKIQSEYAVADGSFKDAEVTFEEYIGQCRNFLTRSLPADFATGSLGLEEKSKLMEDTVSKFVDLHKIKVQGYVSSDGVLDIHLLLQDVIDSITGASVIKEPLEDEDVDEIQINDEKSIFIIKKGRNMPLVDSKGRVVTFANSDEINILLNRLVEDGSGTTPQFTDGLPLLNAKTAKHQYRVSATHSVANTRDKPPFDFNITTVVIRKFKKIKLTLDDLVASEAMTPKMGRLFRLIGKADVKIFFIGKTGSGKTTLLNVVAQEIPIDNRIILVQNPTEITLFDRDEFGRNRRNVLHWEVKDTDKVGPRSATMSNLLSHILRNTPDVAIVGEARTPEEFQQVQRGLKMGERYMGTFHSEDAEQALERFADEVSSNGNTSVTEARKSLAKNIDIIVAQHKFSDGRRRIMEIAEICGVDGDDNAIIRQLFLFEYNGDVTINEDGSRTLIGDFVQKEPMSLDLQKKFYRAGITKEELHEFTVIEN